MPSGSSNHCATVWWLESKCPCPASEQCPSPGRIGHTLGNCWPVGIAARWLWLLCRVTGLVSALGRFIHSTVVSGASCVPTSFPGSFYDSSILFPKRSMLKRDR